MRGEEHDHHSRPNGEKFEDSATANTPRLESNDPYRNYTVSQIKTINQLRISDIKQRYGYYRENDHVGLIFLIWSSLIAVVMAYLSSTLNDLEPMFQILGVYILTAIPFFVFEYHQHDGEIDFSDAF